MLMHKISNWVVCVNGNHPRTYMEGSVIFRLVSLGGVYWENSHRRESHTGMTFWFCIAFTWWLGHFISRYLKVHFMLIKYMCDSKLQTLHMRYPFQSTGRPISYQNGWSFRAYTILLWDSYRSEILTPVQEPGWTHTGVSHTGMTFCGGIM